MGARSAALLCTGAAVALAAGFRVPLGLDGFVPAPEANPLTREQVELGRRLFFDKSLSRDRTIACATCHDPDRAFTDAEPQAVGVEGKRGTRRSPALLNRAWGRGFFWDGRAATLEEQVVQPIANPIEMDLAPAEAARRVGLDEQALARALAAYVRSILAGGSPYDRYVRGDTAALSAVQVEGLKLFRGKANCTSCHLGPNLTDERFHNTGAGKSADPGRFAVTGRPADRGAFKTPTLREIARRAPYMHDGSLATLEDVVDHYDQGGKESESLDPEIGRLRLTDAEKAALVEFLKSLTGEIREGAAIF